MQSELKQESNDREEEVVEKSVAMNFSTNGKKSKKKVSWDEKVVVYNYPCMDLMKKFRKCKKKNMNLRKKTSENNIRKCKHNCYNFFFLTLSDNGAFNIVKKQPQ